MSPKGGLQLLALGLSVSLSIAGTVSNAVTSITLLYQNNLNATDDVNHVGFLLLDDMSQKDAVKACEALGEKLLSKSTIDSNKVDITQSLSYVDYAQRASRNQLYFIDGGALLYSSSKQSISYANAKSDLELPVLCTQSSTSSQPATSKASATNLIQVASSGNTFVGYRNKKSFRFLGIPYADVPERWTYPTLYSKVGQTINATAYGSQCAQGGSGSENCLFLNIQTPYIPKQGDKSDLRPVMFWIHGGGFTGGSGQDSLSDGGNLASREDLVVVNINYRLSTLGFLAIPGTNVTGNYGIADQIKALEWTVKNIAAFGGDPKQITISGESAGAGSVRALLGSPPAIGKFQGAIAMSNLGGGVTLGVNGDYATTYSTYLSLNESYNTAGQKIFTAANCTQIMLDAQIACLKTVPATTLVGLSTVARYVVQDGKFVNTQQLNVKSRNPGTAHVPVIFGIVENDGASFSTYPKPQAANSTLTTAQAENVAIQKSLGISASYAQSIQDSGLFPFYSTGNLTLDAFNVSQRVATDIQFRCIDQATVYAASQSGAFESSYYYEFQRSIGGYDPNGLGGPPKSAAFPNGNPDLPYFKLHGADMPWVFGNLQPLRNADDLYSIQLVSAYFAEFIKDGQPNPQESYLKARGYTKTLEAVQKTGLWKEVDGETGPTKLLDYPSVTAPFLDTKQCSFLNYSLSYYLDGGK